MGKGLASWIPASLRTSTIAEVLAWVAWVEQRPAWGLSLAQKTARARGIKKGRWRVHALARPSSARPRLPSPISRDAVDEITYGHLRFLTAEAQIAPQHFPHIQVSDRHKLGALLLAFGRGTVREQGTEHVLDPGLVVAAAGLSDLAESGSPLLLGETVQHLIPPAFVGVDQVPHGSRHITDWSLTAPESDLLRRPLRDGREQLLLGREAAQHRLDRDPRSLRHRLQ